MSTEVFVQYFVTPNIGDRGTDSSLLHVSGKHCRGGAQHPAGADRGYIRESDL